MAAWHGAHVSRCSASAAAALPRCCGGDSASGPARASPLWPEKGTRTLHASRLCRDTVPRRPRRAPSRRLGHRGRPAQRLYPADVTARLGGHEPRDGARERRQPRARRRRQAGRHERARIVRAHGRVAQHVRRLRGNHRHTALRARPTPVSQAPPAVVRAWRALADAGAPAARRGIGFAASRPARRCPRSRAAQLTRARRRGRRRPARRARAALGAQRRPRPGVGQG
jgi:hypothetical protein